MKNGVQSQKVQAVFLDIDGTLFYEGTMIPSAGDAVRKLKAAGIRTAICTGRSILHGEKVQRQLQLDDAVYFNGGLAIASGRVVASCPLSPEIVQRTIQFSPSNQLPIILHTRTRTLIFEAFPDTFQPILDAYDYPPLHRIETSHWNEQAEDVYQINVFMEQTWDQKVQNDFPECLLYRWHENAVDLQKRGCDKAMGAHSLLDAWNLSPEHALHIGDGGNDVGMFHEMGYSVAMGNATEEVKRHARLVTASAVEDGVYKALQGLGLIP